MVKATPKRGDIWWYELPGREPRPVLVLTRTAAIGFLNRVLAVPATRTVREIPTEVYVDQNDGMPQPSVLSVDNLDRVPRAYLTERVTTLSESKMAEVCAALARAVAC